MLPWPFELGHRRFAVVAGAEGQVVCDSRIGGRRALDEAGPGDRVTVHHGDIAAVLAANNFTLLRAIGAPSALNGASRRVSEDVALVASDDLPPAFVTQPFLTVAAQPFYEMGRQAAELLIARSDAPEPPPFQRARTCSVPGTPCKAAHEHA